MARRSAIIDCYLGNRRFHDFVFEMRDGTIVDFWRMDWRTNRPVDTPLKNSEIAAISMWIN